MSKNYDKEEKGWERKLIIFYLIFVLVIGAFILFPVITEYPKFPFLISNAIFVFLCGLMIYQLFFPRLSLLARSKWGKIIFILILPLLFFYQYNVIAEFNFYTDRNMVYDDLSYLKYARQDWLANYVQKEYLFLGILSIISSVLVGFNFMRLLWLQINKK